MRRSLLFLLLATLTLLAAPRTSVAQVVLPSGNAKLPAPGIQTPLQKALQTGIVATTDLGPITVTELERFLALTGSRHVNAIRELANPTFRSVAEREATEQIVKDAVESVAAQRYWAQQAKAAGLAAETEAVASRRKVYESCVAAHWHDALRPDLTTLTLDQFRPYFEAYRQRVERDEFREVCYIFLKAADGETPTTSTATYQRLAAIRNEITSGKLSFRQAALKYSQAPSAAKEGRLGQLSRASKLNRAFLDLVFRTPENSISPVAILKNGYYLVKVEALLPEIRLTAERAYQSAYWKPEFLSMAAQDLITSRVLEIRHRYPDAPSEQAALFLDATANSFRVEVCEIDARLSEEANGANSWFQHRFSNRLVVEEAELRAYYKEHPDEMLETGHWRFTRFLIPVASDRDATLDSRTKAEALMEKVRAAAAADATTTAALLQQFAETGLRIDPDPEWKASTGDSVIDQEFVSLPTGNLSRVRISADGAYFFRLDARRILKPLPFEAKRQYIEELLGQTKRAELIARERAAAARAISLRQIWLDRATH